MSAAFTVKQARLKAGLTQAEAAARIRVSRRVWIYWEKGMRNPTPGNLLMIDAFVIEKPKPKRTRTKK